MRDELFGLRPRHSTPLQLARLDERITRNLGVKGSPAQFSSMWPKPSILLYRWPPLRANVPKLPVLYSPYNLILHQVLEVRSVLPNGHIISPRHAGWCSLGGLISQVLFSLYVKDMPQPRTTSNWPSTRKTRQS